MIYTHTFWPPPSPLPTHLILITFISLIYFRLDLTPEQAYKAESGKDYPEERKYIELACDAELDDMTYCVIPKVKYQRK